MTLFKSVTRRRYEGSFDNETETRGGGVSVAADFVQLPSTALYNGVLALLKIAREQNRRITLTRMKIAKLLYLADLDAVADGKPPISGALWRWLNYGPFDYEFYSVEDQLDWSGKVALHDGRLPHVMHGSVVLELKEDVPDPLPAGAMAILRKVLEEHGAKSASALKDLSYQTSPMLEAQAAGERGVKLNLDRARQDKKAKAAIKRYRALRVASGPEIADLSAREDLRAEFDEMRDLRQRANVRGLGDA